MNPRVTTKKKFTRILVELHYVFQLATVVYVRDTGPLHAGPFRVVGALDEGLGEFPVDVLELVVALVHEPQASFPLHYIEVVRMGRLAVPLEAARRIG